jgi:hypothetical protein
MSETTPTAPLPAGKLVRGYGWWLALMAAGAMPVLWFAFSRLAVIADSHREERIEIDAVTAWCVDHPPWMMLLAAPAVAFGVAVARRRRSWALALAGTAALLVPFAVTLYCFIMLIAPLYEVRPL